jgi:hypothetical protein
VSASSSGAGQPPRGWAEFNALFERRDLTTEDKAVYLYLWRRAGRRMSCWPSLHTIARAASVERKTVLVVLKRLREKMLVVWATEPLPGQGGRRNVYTLIPVSHWHADQGPVRGRRTVARLARLRGQEVGVPDGTTAV